jgi:Uma2 family endonuclease
MTTPYPKAPPICVEIASPSNTSAEMEEKITLYLAKGAEEVWICDLDGQITVHSHEGALDASRLAPDAPRTL